MRIAVAAYVLALVAANLLVAHFGPGSAPFIAFGLIGLELALRDWLHMRMQRWHMLGLILFAGAISYVLNPAAGHIALASWVAFIAAALADWLVFASLQRLPWIARSFYSNVAGAVVDSVLFLAIAFGIDPYLLGLQIAAKVFGGTLWAIVLEPKRAVA